MSNRPSRDSTAGRTYLALRKKAREEGRPTDELLQLAALEAFLVRLATSARAADLVLKGGVLLAAYDVRRPTRDVDLVARNVANDPGSIEALINTILRIELDDGWTFSATSAEPIREDAQYAGVRVHVPCTLATARLTFHVDVNVGDAISPPPITVILPRLLGGEIRTLGYVLSMILAEKLVTAVQRGVGNTRWRDFVDVLLLSRMHDCVGQELADSMRAVSVGRGARLAPLATVLEGYASIAQRRWEAWLRKQRLHERVPVEFGAVLAEVQAFADPVLVGAVNEHTWYAARATWST